MGSDASRHRLAWEDLVLAYELVERLEFTTAGPAICLVGVWRGGQSGRPSLYYWAVGPSFQPVTLPRRSTFTTASRMTAPPNDSSKDGMLKSRWLMVATPK